MRLNAFDYEIEYIKGTSNIADPSSRLCTKNGDPVAYREERSPGEIAHIQFDPTEDFAPNQDGQGSIPEFISAIQVKYETSRCAELSRVRTAMEAGRWDEEGMAPYGRAKEELEFVKGIMAKSALIVIPVSLRRKAVEIAHIGHPGITKTKSVLKERVWWPGMYADAE